MNDHDDELARALGRSLDTIQVADPDAALARVTARSRVVRRRRMVVRAGAAVAAAAVVLAVWLGARPPGSTQVDTVDTPSIPTAPRTVTDGTDGTDGPSRTTPVTTGGSASTVATSVPASVPTTAPPSAAPAAPPASAGTTPPPVSTVPPPTAAPSSASPPPSSGPQTYGGLGGQVTVRVDAGNLVLMSVRPAAGYTVAEQRARPDDVEVRFEGPAGRTRVRIRLNDGVVSPEVQEEGPG